MWLLDKVLVLHAGATAVLRVKSVTCTRGLANRRLLNRGKRKYAVVVCLLFVLLVPCRILDPGHRHPLTTTRYPLLVTNQREQLSSIQYIQEVAMDGRPKNILASDVHNIAPKSAPNGVLHLEASWDFAPNAT
jgi:hypothetical protein